MGRAITGAIELGAAVAGLAALTVVTGGGSVALDFVLSTPLGEALGAIALSGAATEISAVVSALSAGPGASAAIRQPAAPRQFVYGTARVGGVVAYMVVTGHQLDQVILLAADESYQLINVYLDGQQVYWATDTTGQYTVNGITCGGNANGTTYKNSFNATYNYGGLVFVDTRLGAPGQTYFATLQAQAGSDWGPTDTLTGQTAIFLKCTYDANQFPSGIPNVRVTMNGKCNIYDPRTQTYGFSCNAALVIADFLCDTNVGFGYNMQTQINQAQLIAAANLCDEQVALAGGGTESRYCINGVFDSTSEPGDILQQFLDSCAGRISEQNGQIFIYPGAFIAPTLTFDASDLVGPVEWNPTRSYAELSNRVRGTYVAPVYPYNIESGNYYDSNGFGPNGDTESYFNLNWEPASYPDYACDTLHGYQADAYLAADQGNTLVMNLSFRFVTSISQAQRLAKIALLRNRYQGTGTLQMSLAAYQLQKCDTFLIDFPALSWEGKMLEVGSVGFKINADAGGEDAPFMSTEIGVNETDPSIYDWTTEDELSPYDVETNAVIVNGNTLIGPTSVTAVSNSATAYVSPEGVIYPRILVSWTAPNTSGEISQYIQVQWQTSGGAWNDSYEADISSTSCLISGIVSGQTYSVRVRSLATGGQYSAWTQLAIAIPAIYSSLNSLGLSPNLIGAQANNATVDSILSGSTATVEVYGASVGSSYTQTLGSQSLTLPGASITGQALSTLIYVAWNTTTQAYLTTTNYTATLADSLILIGAVTTVSSSGTGGVRGGGGRFSVET